MVKVCEWKLKGVVKKKIRVVLCCIFVDTRTKSTTHRTEYHCVSNQQKDLAAIDS